MICQYCGHKLTDGKCLNPACPGRLRPTGESSNGATRVKTRKVHRCIECQKDIPVGAIAYRIKTFYSDDDATGSYCFYECSRCHYYRIEHQNRLEAFKPHCHHPITFDVWSCIPGECVMQPDHDECMICGAWM